MENRKRKSVSSFGRSLIKKNDKQFDGDFLIVGPVNEKKGENRAEWDYKWSGLHKGDACASQSLSPSNSSKDEAKSYFRDEKIDNPSFRYSPVSFVSALETIASQDSGESRETREKRKEVKSKSKTYSLTERRCSLFRSDAFMRLVEENEACYMVLWAAEISASTRQSENHASHQHPDDHVKKSPQKKNSCSSFSSSSFLPSGVSPPPRRPFSVLSSSSPPEEGPSSPLCLSYPSSDKKIRTSKWVMPTVKHRIAFKVKVQKVNNRKGSHRRTIRDVSRKKKRNVTTMPNIAAEAPSASRSCRTSSVVLSSRTLQSNLTLDTSIDMIATAQSGTHLRSEEKPLPFSHSFMSLIRIVCGRLRGVRMEIELFTSRVSCSYSSFLRPADQRHLWHEVIQKFQMLLFDCGKLIKDLFASFFLHFSDSFSVCSAPQSSSKNVVPLYPADCSPFDVEKTDEVEKKEVLWFYHPKEFQEEPMHRGSAKALQDLQIDLEKCQSDAVAVFYRVERDTRNLSCAFSFSDDKVKHFPFKVYSGSSLSKENSQRSCVVHEHSQEGISSSLHEASRSTSSQNTVSCDGHLREWTETSAAPSLDYSICSHKEKEKNDLFPVPFSASSSRVYAPLPRDSGSSVSLVSRTVLLSLLSSVLETWSSVRLSLELLLELMKHNLQKM